MTAPDVGILIVLVTFAGWLRGVVGGEAVADAGQGAGMSTPTRRQLAWWWLTSFWQRCHCGDWADMGRFDGVLWCTPCKYAAHPTCECSRREQS